MEINASTVRRYDEWLIAITVIVVALFVYTVNPYIELEAQQGKLSQIEHLQSPPASSVPLSELAYSDSLDWVAIENPVNLGMLANSQWFRFTIEANDQNHSPLLLEVAYPLLDNITVAYFVPGQRQPLAIYRGGDSLAFEDWVIKYPSMLFPVPVTDQTLQVVLKVQSNGSIKVPVRVWEKVTFIEKSSGLTLLMGCFLGFLLAIGLSNFFFFLTTHSNVFLSYTCYVFSLALTLSAMNGHAYAYLWPDWVWFEHRAVAVFANAAIMFAMFFSRQLLDITQYSKRLDKALKWVGILFGANVLVSFILPYGYLIKAFLILLCLVVMFIFFIGVWLSFKGHIVARYYSIAWGIILLSGFLASMDNLGVWVLPVPSIYLLMLGATVETILLAFVIAISYSQHKDAVYASRQRALTQEQAALAAREDLLTLEKQHQDDLEYKVQERTLELEIALRELSAANQELETLNSIDSLTGIKNRRQFDKRLLAESRRSRREQTPLSVAMVDIDHFKNINDTYGHSAGDECIRHVANLLKLLLRRSSDDVCRYGGEEFGIILPNTDEEGARQVLESMREKVENTPVVVDGQVIPMTISAGVASTIIVHAEHEAKLLKFADAQLYVAKQQGRNRVVAEYFTGD